MKVKALRFVSLMKVLLLFSFSHIPLFAQSSSTEAALNPRIDGSGIFSGSDTGSGIGGTPGFLITIPTMLSLPLGESGDLFTASGAFQAGGEYCFNSFGGRFQPFTGASIWYGFLPIQADTSASVFSAEGTGGLYFWLSPRIAVRGSLGAGYWNAFLNDTKTTSGNFAAHYGLGVHYLLSPSLNLGIDARYRYQAGLYQGLELAAQVSIALTGKDTRKKIIETSSRPQYLQQGPKSPEKGRGIELANLSLKEIFPVFHKYYDDNPAGRVTLVNKEQTPITDIKMSFFIKQYMDSPKECPVPESLRPGERIDADIMALLTERILEVTEATKVSGEIVLDYRMDGELYRDTRSLTLRVLDRNAMTWDDDRRAAAFVTAKDPRVLSFAKQAVGISRDQGPQALDRNLLAGMAVFKQLDLYGLSYVVDPKTPFAEFSASDTSVDFLQFPRQTLEYKAGDCDDLSILFAALMESVGIESAFITVPGHIFMAFAAQTKPSDLERNFSNAADLIVIDDRVWVPVEVTERREGFLKAWQTGAFEWREASAKQEAAFYPIHAAWQLYEPVGLPGSGGEITIPQASEVLAAFLKETDRLSNREITPKVKKIEEQMARQGKTPALYNKLGVLYAMYGFMDKAEAEFGKAHIQGDFAPALVNLGNLHFLQRNYPKAQEMYERAAKLNPDNAMVLVNLTKVYQELNKSELAGRTFDRLVLADPELAAKYSYLGASSGEGRASERAGGNVVWWEE
jgi:tetratricopeptide (TPR) repeat protein